MIFILIVADICFLHRKATAICFAKYAVSVKFPTTTLVHSYLKDEALHEHYHWQIGTAFQTFSVDIQDDIVHLFTGCEWNSSFIQAEAGTIPRGLARGE